MSRRGIGIALLAPLAAAACAGGFETPSIVRDLRVLGLRADPAEVVLDVDLMHLDLSTLKLPPITITVLLADPGADRMLDWNLVACAPTTSERCDDPAAPFDSVGFGTIADPEGPVPLSSTDPRGEITATLNVTPDVLMAALASPDSLAGFSGLPVQLELSVWPHGADPKTAIFAAKRVIFAPRIPKERKANQNPFLDELQANGEPFVGDSCASFGEQPRVVLAGSQNDLLPVEPDGVRENYVLPTFEGGETRLTENMTYSWFATAGGFSLEFTGGPIDIFGNVPTLDTTWQAPFEEDLPKLEGGGLVRIWVVTRDERGGTFWSRRCFQVIPRP